MSQATAEAGDPHQITSIEQLESHYGEIVPLAISKELDRISDHYRAYIDAAPFVVLATSGPDGLDCSPRGDPAGFVRVVDEKTVMIPDRRGNNRLDSIRNIVVDPRVALLFLIPGIEMTMRINGRAKISVDPDLRDSFAHNGKVPASVIVITVDAIYPQCPKALVRSKLWNEEARVAKSDLPTAGQIYQGLTKGDVNSDQYDRDYPERMKQTIY